ncbi:MAG: phosphate transport system regulatory protein PhoU [Chloroflexi bacterium]|nr:MAG: phosphate transport system regulatory protein PhoU [Chloroflexota bacterium]
MVRTMFSRELEKLQDDVLVLGSMVRQAILDAVEALRARDHDAARRIIAGDRQINARKYTLEQNCLTLIATQQPMARDLRFLAAVLDISTELERMGDYAKGISKINLYLGHEPLVKPLIDIPRMADKAMDMLQRSLDAFVNQDVEAARAIPLEDDEIDALYNKVSRDLIELIIKNPEIIDRANYLSWVAHNLERAADRVTNICERVIYTVTGDLVEFDAEEPFLSGTN